MISKQQQKYIQSLHNKKNRTEYGQFLVEGEKSLAELLNSDFKLDSLFCTEAFASKYKIPSKSIVCSTQQIESVSTFKSNASGIAIVQQKQNIQPQNYQKVTLFLNDINDPGNLGTIIRLAVWYGIENLVCSLQTVEFYNPKVISSSMGSFTRVNVFYTNLSDFLKNWCLPLYGADLEGKNVHKHNFEDQLGLIIGSESHGISDDMTVFISQKLTIPRLGQAESLNAAMATGIILDNIFRGI